MAVPEIEKIMLDDLIELPWNPREISEAALTALKDSIKQGTRVSFDWNPDDGFRLNVSLTVNKNGMRIVGGHQRVRALRELGQNWVHVDDITWVDIEPNSLEEKERCITLNNAHVAGFFTPDALGIVKELGDLELPNMKVPAIDDLMNSLTVSFGDVFNTIETKKQNLDDHDVTLSDDNQNVVTCPFCAKEFPIVK